MVKDTILIVLIVGLIILYFTKPTPKSVLDSVTKPLKVQIDSLTKADVRAIKTIDSLKVLLTEQEQIIQNKENILPTIHEKYDKRSLLIDALPNDSAVLLLSKNLHTQTDSTR